MKKYEGTYHYRESGLDNVYLEGGVYVTQMDGEPCYSIVDIEGLHKAIGKSIATSTSPLDNKAFRFLRVELGYTQQALADAMGVDVQTIANYEKKKTEIPVPTDRLFRIIYLQTTAEILAHQMKELKTQEAMLKDIRKVALGAMQKSTRKSPAKNIFHLNSRKNWKLPTSKQAA